ncbi:MAG: MGH1-like glycoside hydrolase domain-containing protein [Candidatus Acidiferrales bacterium]
MREGLSEIVPPWHRWGPYLSERAWGTVREDYSPDGSAWTYLPHDMARSKAYRWGEDGIAGICDRYQILCFALALWNGRDPILKERMFGLTPMEANHGEDVKEYYFYLDSTPTHSYMKMLYKYPQREYPYGLLVEENRRRGGGGFEFELLDTGIFDDNRYFDVFVEYAKAAPDDIAIRIEVCNRGPETAPIELIPTLWFRNIWGWTDPPANEPIIRTGPAGKKFVSLQADDTMASPLPNLIREYRLGERCLYGPPGGELLFTDNETNLQRFWGPHANSRKPHTKDAFHAYIIHGEASLNTEQTGTKSAMRYRANVPAGGSVVLRLRLSNEKLAAPIDSVDAIVRERKSEADEFYASIHPPRATEDEKMVERQALAGLLWSKQSYLFDVEKWLDGDNPNFPPAEARKQIRNSHWRHLNSMRVLSMPDKWEYPWFAAWDLAFHCIALSLVDPHFAKENLWVLLFEQFQHTNGQIPAYEWEFSDLNPPVQAWACWRVYNMEKHRWGNADRMFLEKCFHKLLINFAWWVNKVDSQGLNVFEGGFLGLDNITVVDRSEKLPGGAILEQSDATGWMGFFCLFMMRIALELARENKAYEGLAVKFFEHYIYIGSAMKKMGGRDYQLWDDRDGFFYDTMRYPDGQFHHFRVRSLVGLIPLYAVEVLRDDPKTFPEFIASVDWFIRNRPDLVGRACYSDTRDGVRHHVLSIVDKHQLARILQFIWNSDEFLSPAGLRSLSKFHEANPFQFQGRVVRYEPAEADSKIKGGNSNWRGPIWFPTSFLLIESLEKFSEAFGEDFAVVTPESAGKPIKPREMAREVAKRMIRLFCRDEHGRRPIFGGTEKFQQDPFWRDCLLFNEYFHGDNGAGLGANHQTGWTGLVANLIDEWCR